MEASSTPEVHGLDLRPVIASGGCPLTTVLETVGMLPPSASLRLIAPFEPIPLFAKLADLGYDHNSRRRDDGCYEVMFTRPAPPPEPAVLDLRHSEEGSLIEPVLAALNALARGQLLIVRTRHHPEPLFAPLREAKASWDPEPLADGSWQTCIAPPLSRP